MSTNSRFKGVELKPQKPSYEILCIGLICIGLSVAIIVIITGLEKTEEPTIAKIVDLSIIPEKQIATLNAPLDVETKVIQSFDDTKIGCTLFSCKEYNINPKSGKDFAIDWRLTTKTPVLLDEIKLELCCDHAYNSVPAKSQIKVPQSIGWYDLKRLSDFDVSIINSVVTYTYKEKDWLITEDGYYPIDLWVPDIGQFNDFPIPNALQFKLSIMTKDPNSQARITHYDTVTVFYYENEKYTSQEKLVINRMLQKGESVQYYDLVLQNNGKGM